MSGELRDGSYVWDVTDEKLISKIHSVEAGERFDSEIFEIASSKWFLRLFPNGTKQKYQGRVSLFLQLCSLPEHINKLKVKLVLSCDETNTQYSDIKNFSDDREFGGWTGGILTTNDLKKHMKLTFRVDIIVIAKYDKQHQPSMSGTVETSAGSPAVTAASVLSPSAMSVASSFANKDIHHHRAPSSKYIKLQKHNESQIQTLKNKLLIHATKLESIENVIFPSYVTRLDSLNLSIKQLTNSMNDINDSIKKMNNKIDANNDSANYKIKKLKKDLKSIKKTLNISNNNDNDDSDDDDEYDSHKKRLKFWFSNDIKLPQYFDVFIENGLEEMSVISTLTMNELNLIGITKLGHKIKILQQIEKYQNRDQTMTTNIQHQNIKNEINSNMNDDDSKVSDIQPAESQTTK